MPPASVVVPSSLLRQLGLDTERIIAPFSWKGVNHVAYLAHVATVTWRVLLFCLSNSFMPSFSDITDVSTIGNSFNINNSRTALFHVAQYEDDIVDRELNLDEICLVDSESRTHNLPKS